MASGIRHPDRAQSNGMRERGSRPTSSTTRHGCDVADVDATVVDMSSRRFRVDASVASVWEFDRGRGRLNGTLLKAVATAGIETSKSLFVRMVFPRLVYSLRMWNFVGSKKYYG